MSTLNAELKSTVSEFYANSLNWFVFRSEHIAYIAKRFGLTTTTVEEIVKDWNQNI